MGPELLGVSRVTTDLGMLTLMIGDFVLPIPVCLLAR